MTVNRRTALKQFVFISAGVAILPACLQEDKSKASVLLKNFQITGQQEKDLADLAETIIPATATPGAKDISAHLFVLKMMDDCHTKADQYKFLQGLQAFEKNTKAQYNKPFHQCSIEEKIVLVTSINGRKDIDPAIGFFYNSTKKLTIQAYSTSQFYLTKIQVYKMVPGKYQGCVPVKNDLTKTS